MSSYVYYLLIGLATVLFSFQFVFQKMFQREKGQSLAATCVFSLYTCALFGCFMWMLNGFTLQITLFSVGMALLSAIVSLSCRYSGLVAMSVADLAKYSLYLMLGGMVVPFLYGILFNGDDFTWQKLGCFLLVGAAVFVSKLGGKTGGQVKHAWKARICYAVLFLTNGLIGVISTVHQQSGFDAVASRDFTILSMLMNVLCSGTMLVGISIVDLIRRHRNGVPSSSAVKEKSRKGILAIVFAVVGYGLANGIGNYLLLISLTHVEPSVQYSMVTGGCILMTVVTGLIFREKITRYKVISAVLIIGGTLLLLL